MKKSDFISQEKWDLILGLDNLLLKNKEGLDQLSEGASETISNALYWIRTNPQDQEEN